MKITDYTDDKRRLHRLSEFCIENLIKISGVASIILVCLIFIFLLKEGLSIFKTIAVKDFLFGKDWYPIWSEKN